MKRIFYTASIAIMFSLVTMPSVLAKPKFEQINPNTISNTSPNDTIYNTANPNVSPDSFNILGNNRSNAGGVRRGYERATYVQCLNAAKKKREYNVNNNCTQNQIQRQHRNNVQQTIPNKLHINIIPMPTPEQK